MLKLSIVVTGAAGFIASYICRDLYEHGYEVLCIDNFSRARSYAVRMLKKYGLEVIKADIRDYERLKELFMKSRPMAVVHAAAYIDVGESLERPDVYAGNNIVSTATILRLLRDLNIKSIVFLSSAAVYGNPMYVPIDEDHPPNPLSPYGLYKLCEEGLIKLMCRVFGCSYIILRIFNAYGLGQSGEYAGVVSKFVKAFIENRPPIIYGDGMQTRDFIYVEDVSKIVILALEYALNKLDRAEGTILNVGTGKEIRILDIVKLLRDITKKDIVPMFTRPRSGDIKRSCADISRLRALLNYIPQTPFDVGLRKLYEVCSMESDAC